MRSARPQRQLYVRFGWKSDTRGRLTSASARTAHVLQHPRSASDGIRCSHDGAIHRHKRNGSSAMRREVLRGNRCSNEQRLLTTQPPPLSCLRRIGVFGGLFQCLLGLHHSYCCSVRHLHWRKRKRPKRLQKAKRIRTASYAKKLSKLAHASPRSGFA